MSAKGTTVFDYAAAGERLYALRVALGRSRSDVVRDSDGTLDETYLGRVETGVADAGVFALSSGGGVWVREQSAGVQ